MRIFSLFIVMLSIFSLFSCGSKSKSSNVVDDRVRICVETNKGAFTVALYNETPLHRDNFIKLVRDGVYENTLFHRVIKGFMVQAGDPNSKDAPNGALLGDGDMGYTIPAEFNPNLFHKRGALAAARMGDEVNPEKRSSGCQFYVVTGRKYREGELLEIEGYVNNTRLQAVGEEQYMKEPKFKYSDAQKQIYSSQGGTPFLDTNYTVFGEVIEGMSVIEDIENSITDGNDRPTSNVRILKAAIVK